MKATTTKVLAGLVLFASGVVMGFFGSRYLAERGRLALLHGDPRHFAEMVLRHMASDLDLTREQQEKLRPIVLNTADELAKIRREQEPKVREVIEKSFADTKALLTPDQREKFTTLMDRLERRRKAMERFGPPPPPPPGQGFPPPPPPDGLGGHRPPPPPGMGDFPPPPPPGFDGPMPPPEPPMPRLEDDIAPDAAKPGQPAPSGKPGASGQTETPAATK